MTCLPVAVIQNIDTGGVGYFGVFAQDAGLPLRTFHGYAGEELPSTLEGFSGLCILGGPMSANDDIPYLRHTERLIRGAVSDDKPVIGHCLGGQLMARAFGARVVRSPQPEIGWLEMRTKPASNAREWFGENEFTIFHWHHEAFEIPVGADHLATSPWCNTQAYALGERHLGMQFHCEITPEIISDWLAEKACQHDLQRHAPVHDSVQDELTMRADTHQYIDASYRTAATIYRRWMRYLVN